MKDKTSSKNEEIVETITVRTVSPIKENETKSKYIRRCFFEEGFTVNEISKGSGILYQMVRNIVTKEKDARDLERFRASIKATE